MEIFKRIREWYTDVTEKATYLFTSEPYEKGLGKVERFPSVTSVVIRFLLKHLYLVALAVLVATMIVGFCVGEIPVIGVVIVSPIGTVLFAVVAVLIFAVVCIVESFAKILASLILYNEYPRGAENPPDALLMAIIRSKK